VTTEQRKRERAETELARLETLRETRTARWTAVGALERNITDWLMHGIPGDVVLESVADRPLSELLVKADGGRFDKAIERYRLRLRELGADLHRARSSPWPSSVAKAAATELITRLADAGQPNLDGAIEHNAPIAFAQARLTSTVYNVPTPGAIAFSEHFDALATMAWLWRDQMIAKLHAEIDAVADDVHARDHQQRETLEAQIASDMLSAERAECSLIWAADAKGEIIDFRNDTSSVAVLGVELRTVPQRAPGPSSPNLAFDRIG
jgi:hypothetical protein